MLLGALGVACQRQLISTICFLACPWVPLGCPRVVQDAPRNERNSHARDAGLGGVTQKQWELRTL